jgi:hypothetical protein
MDSKTSYPNGSFGSFKPRYIKAGDGTNVFVMPGVPRHLRVRATLAQVNAGLVVLPALPGFGYRIVDCSMIAIGGAAAGGTSVDLLGTKAGSASRPVVNAVAGLTQSANLRMGAANSTILADGASHTVHDQNTTLSITKQSGGSNITTSTNFDLLLTYVAE